MDVSKKSIKNLRRSIIILLCSFVIVVAGYFVFEHELIKESEKYSSQNIVNNDVDRGDFQSNTIVNDRVVVKNVPTDIQTIGYKTYFLGTFEDGKWYSAEEIKSTSNNEFTINCENNVTLKEYDIDDIASRNKIFYLDGEKHLPKTSLVYDKEENPEHYFKIYYFRYNLAEFLSYEDVENKDNFFVVSQELTTPCKDTYEVTLDKTSKEKYEKMAKEVLVKDRLDNEPIITSVYSVDTDNDGSVETYIVVNNNDNYEIGKDNNCYYYLLNVEGNSDKAEIIMKDNVDKTSSVSPALNRMINDVDFIDYNNDGKLEIIIETITWDIPEVFVIDKVDDKYELNLYGNFAW